MCFKETDTKRNNRKSIDSMIAFFDVSLTYVVRVPHAYKRDRQGVQKGREGKSDRPSIANSSFH